MYFHRYIRLTPSLAVVILYIMSWYKYAGEGPMWTKLGTQDQRCSHTWWATLLYLQNYLFPSSMVRIYPLNNLLDDLTFPTHLQCISQSWYLAVDMQLYILSPIFLLSLWKWRHKAVVPIALLGLLSLLCTFVMYMVFDFTLYRFHDSHLNLRQQLTYLPTHTRLSPWLIGTLFGYFLHFHNRREYFAFSNKAVWWGWFSAITLMMICLWGPYWRALPKYSDASIVEGALYESLVRCTWTLCLTWVVWACYNGYGGLVNDFLSWNGFTIFGHLSYSIYVTHRIIQFVNVARLQHDMHFSNYDAVSSSNF